MNEPNHLNSPEGIGYSPTVDPQDGARDKTSVENGDNHLLKYYEEQFKKDRQKANCPHCGRCQTCGRSGYQFPGYPQYPQYGANQWATPPWENPIVY